MKILKKCDICNGKDFKPLYKLNDKATGLEGEFFLFKCNKCGVIFINPQPSFAELRKYYEGGYYSLKKIIAKEESKKARFRIFLYNLYFNEKSMGTLKKIIFYPIKNYLRGTIISNDKKILDVGSGSGQFLYEMKELGMNAYGTEPGDFNKESARQYNLNIKNKDLISSRYPKNFFDIITLSQVLEHTPNPADTIRELYRILAKNGTLIIGVPNTNSLAYKIFGKNWYQLDVPRHLFDFSDKILIKKLEKEGFRIQKVRYISRPTQFTISLKYLLKIKKTNKIGVIMDALFTPLTYFCNILKKGDSVEIWCTKD